MHAGSVDEARDDWRGLFFMRFMPLVERASSLSEAALILNRDIWGIWNITFKANQTPDIMSPFQVSASIDLKLGSQVKRRADSYKSLALAGHQCRPRVVHRPEHLPG